MKVKGKVLLVSCSLFVLGACANTNQTPLQITEEVVAGLIAAAPQIEAIPTLSQHDKNEVANIAALLQADLPALENSVNAVAQKATAQDVLALVEQLIALVPAKDESPTVASLIATAEIVLPVLISSL